MADKIIRFNRNLQFTGSLPKGIRVMNPFQENAEVLKVSDLFYQKFYSDRKPRYLILGINPGRLGAGATGIPFTDTKRLSDSCGIQINSVHTHEPSSVFVYDMIASYGGVEKFYKRYYINSFSPLGFLHLSSRNRWVNCNYYDYEFLFQAAKPFMLDCLKKQIAMGMHTDKVFVLGKKNGAYLCRMNEEQQLFDEIVILDHPRYIEQYKSKERKEYIGAYLSVLR